MTIPHYDWQNRDFFIKPLLEINCLQIKDRFSEINSKISQKLKRKKNSHMKPRTIDIDIVFFDDLTINKPKLTIPHYDWQNRDFFIKPLLEINCLQIKNRFSEINSKISQKLKIL